MTKEEISKLNDKFQRLTAAQRIAYCYEYHGKKVVASTSFGLQSAVMLHLICKESPDIPVVFIDTGYLFSETYLYAKQLQELLSINIRLYRPELTAAHQEALYGKLWKQDEKGQQQYALLNKIQPMNQALVDLKAQIWLSGLRKSHSKSRQHREYLEQQKTTIKCYPILDWTDIQVDSYFKKHDLPRHPLANLGYSTMGDWHSTRLHLEGEAAENTRFDGKRYECGLHLDSEQADFQI